MTELCFGPFRLIGQAGPLFRGDIEVRLPPKTLAVLWTLARQPGEVVTKSTLMDSVWPGVTVGEEALTFQIKTLRQLLGDDARSPRYVTTVHRIGFRFIAPTTLPRGIALGRIDDQRWFVGRRREREQLEVLSSAALAGTRQTVFITGDAGVGKTSLAATLVADLQAGGAGIAVGVGQCLESSGGGDAGLPILEALGGLLRSSSEASQAMEIVRRVAPSWLAQLPSLLPSIECETLRRQTSGTPRDRMLWELAEALDLIAASQPVLLLLEDLHWSDLSTLDLVSMLARRRDLARLMLVCSYRPVDAAVTDHAVRLLKPELVVRGHAHEIALGNFDLDEVRDYVSRRFRLAGDDLALRVFERTEGHPLFVTQLAEHIAKTPMGTESTMPTALEELLRLQFSVLEPEDRTLLENASIAGLEFAAAELSACTGDPVEVIEARCDHLARRHQFIEERGLSVWPDGTTCTRYGFRHVLHQQTISRHLSMGQRARLHRLLAERLEDAFGQRAHEIAAPLAAHFDAAGRPAQAVRHYLVATRKALQRNAAGDARRDLERVRALAPALASESERARTGLALLLIESGITQGNHGYGVDETRSRMESIDRLIDRVDEPELQEEALSILWLRSYFASDFEAAGRLAIRTTELGTRLASPFLECAGLAWSGLGLHLRGRHLDAERTCARAVALSEKALSPAWLTTNAEPGCGASTALSLTLWILGRPDEALRAAEDGCARAQRIGNPYLLCAMHGMGLCSVLLYRRDYAALFAATEVAIARSREYGHLESLAWATKFRGIALCASGHVDEGLDLLRSMVAAQLAAGSRVTLTIDYAHEAEICLSAGRLVEAEAALRAAFDIVRQTGECYWEPELMRIEAELEAARTPHAINEITQRLREAMDLSRERGALSMELRTAMSMAHFSRTPHRAKEGRYVLRSVLERLSGGDDTADRIRAHELDAELAAIEQRLASAGSAPASAHRTNG